MTVVSVIVPININDDVGAAINPNLTVAVVGTLGTIELATRAEEYKQ